MMTARIVSITGALFITFGLCIFIPILSGSPDLNQQSGYTRPIQLSMIPDPPDPEKHKPKPLEKPKPPEPEKIKPQTLQSPRKPAPTKPRITLPQLDFSTAPDKAATISIPAPPVMARPETFAPIGKSEFSIGEVDTAPGIVRHIPPIYPIKARRKGIEGRVVLQALINTDGKAVQIKVISADPPKIFDKCSKQALARWTFKPGMIEGRKVSTWIEIPITYTLD